MGALMQQKSGGRDYASEQQLHVVYQAENTQGLLPYLFFNLAYKRKVNEKKLLAPCS